ncbi:MAG: alpha/beta hydrolase [Capnocytophaga sp.]|nr:alpha/beta hydrolase [Capnocytophaga sp.]
MQTNKQKSTIEIPKTYKVIGKILQSISNKWASKYALWLFFTPIKFPMPKREYAMNEQSTQYFLEIPSIGKKINVYEYGSGEKLLLLVHGWSGRGTQLFTMADHFIAQGYKIISFDAPAHGKSESKKTYMKEFVLSILEIGKKYKNFHAIIGHSLGAMSSVNAVRLGLEAEKLVCISGGDLVTDIIDDFCEKMNMNKAVWNYIHDSLNEILKESIHEYSVSNAIQKTNLPTLIIHDEDDIDVSVKCAYSIQKAYPSAELLITKGLGHRRILADSKVIERISEFIK